MRKGEKMGEIFYFDENYSEKAKWCNENDCHIEEIGRDEKGRRFQVVQNVQQDISQRLRMEREEVCFPVINRGKLWYENLTQEQYEQLKVWYVQWLDAPQLKTRPKDLEWLN